MNASVRCFAKRFSISAKEAFDYLNRYNEGASDFPEP